MYIIQVVATLGLLSLMAGEEMDINGWLHLDSTALRSLLSGISELSNFEAINIQRTNNDNDFNYKNQNDDKDEDDDKNKTNVVAVSKSRILGKENRKVKDDEDLVAFINYVYERSLHMLIKYPGKVSNHLRSEFVSLSEVFKEKFREFYNRTLDQLIISDLGVKNVALNTIDSADNILQRLKNDITATLQEHGAPKKVISYSIRQLENDMDQNLSKIREYLCRKFGFCSTSNSFIVFLISIFEILANSDHRSALVQEFVNIALSEALSQVSVKVVNQKQISKLIELFDSVKKKKDAELRKILRHITNNLKDRHKPISLRNSPDVLDTQQAFFEIVDQLEENIPPTKANKKVWRDIKNRLTGWTHTRSDDIKSIVKDLIEHTKSNGISEMSGHQWVKFKKNVDVLLSRI
ncbi:uncharacterized protein LOC128683091 [Plodia interpunctella]|uniref:uncharacterized protein LOC128683091 n=1 Tax=Plodia interpunctella TaxID=58824 RepID=UPI0023689BE5|nr:uncharacterized protein LOC128683091 [Plodia interpunctella]